MYRATFGSFRTAYAATPWSGPVGLCATDLPALAGIVNLAQERLLMDPVAPEEGWWGGWVKMLFNISQGAPNIIAPREVARIILMDVCKRPIFIRNQFWEYLEFGRGLQPTGCNPNCGQSFQAYEREVVPTLNEFVGPKTVRAYPLDPRDVGKTVIVQGPDTNDKQVTSTDALTGTTVLGENLTLNQPFVDTVNVYNDVQGIQKDITFGNVTLFQVDAMGNQTPLSDMQPNETTGYYRKYFVNGLPNNCCNTNAGVIQVSALSKLDLVPVVADQDYLLIQSIPALLSEAQSIRYESMENSTSAQLAAAHHQKALSLLFGQCDHFLGKEHTAIRMPIFGSKRLRPSFA